MTSRCFLVAQADIAFSDPVGGIIRFVVYRLCSFGSGLDRTHQVVNLTPCISINHNWCNSVNLPSLYTSMCDEVTRVEDALYDVRDMLVDSHRGKSDDWEAVWKREFTKVVQDVTQQDAGWK